MDNTATKTNPSETRSELQSVEKSDFSGDFEPTIIEQWKTCVEAANGITEKRNTVNSIFVTINTALFAVVTLSSDCKNILLSGVGILVCFLWLQLLENYKTLNKVKYDIINEIEEMLPLAPFKTEWSRLQNQKGYTGLTEIEKMAPWIFMILYLLAK